MYNDIIRTLNIKVDNLVSIDYAFKNNHSYYFIKLVSMGVFCPQCGRYITKVHAYDSIYLKHSIFISHHTTVIYKRRRYICPFCRITKSEPNPFQSSHPKPTNETVSTTSYFKLPLNVKKTYIKVGLSSYHVMTLKFFSKSPR